MSVHLNVQVDSTILDVQVGLVQKEVVKPLNWNAMTVLKNFALDILAWSRSHFLA